MTASLTAGQSYTVTARVTNKSTKLGQPVGAQLSVSLAALVGSLTIASGQQSYAFFAGESHDFTFPIAVPSGASGAGAIAALLLDPGGNRLGSASLDIQVTGAAPVLAASIDPGVIYNTSLGAWVSITSGMAIAYGLDTYIAPGWMNNSDIPIAGHVTLRVTYPNGTSVVLAATQNQDAVANPGNGWYVQFAPFTTNQKGIYSLHAEVSSGGQLLNSVDFTLVVVAAITAAPVVFTSAQILPFAFVAKYLPAWNLTFYEAAAPMTISWTASERIPPEGSSDQVSIQVSWKLTKGSVVLQGSFSTTPGPGMYGPYYFSPGGGSIGYPYAAASISLETNPPRGTWNYSITCKAFRNSAVIGEATFEGMVTVS